jgi:hypothetical protein
VADDVLDLWGVGRRVRTVRRLKGCARKKLKGMRREERMERCKG